MLNPNNRKSNNSSFANSHSSVLEKMKATLSELTKAFNDAMDMNDPMDRMHNEIGKAVERGKKHREAMDL